VKTTVIPLIKTPRRCMVLAKFLPSLSREYFSVPVPDKSTPASTNDTDTDAGTAGLLHRLKGLSDCLTDCDEPGLCFCTLDDPGGEAAPRSLSLDAKDQFIETVSRLGWVDPDLDWISWSESREARQLRDQPLAMRRATPEQLSRLLTVIARQSSEGSDTFSCEPDLIVGICRRAAELARMIEEGAARCQFRV